MRYSSCSVGAPPSFFLRRHGFADSFRNRDPVSDADSVDLANPDTFANTDLLPDDVGVTNSERQFHANAFVDSDGHLVGNAIPFREPQLFVDAHRLADA